MKDKVLVLDVGGTDLKYCVMGEDLIPEKSGKMRTPLEGLDRYLDVIAEIYESFSTEVKGVAMSVPGIVDPLTGYQKAGGSLDAFVHELPMADLISRRLGGVPVSLENDAKAAGLAELQHGALKGCQNGVAMILGTGVGGCVVVNGEILRGVNDYAGELSMMIFDDSKIINSFGSFWSYPCLANSIGVPTLMDAYAEKAGMEPHSLNGIVFFEKANQGDELALEMLRQYCKRACIPIGIMQVMIDAEVVAIGGGISNQPLLINMLNDAYDEFLQNDVSYQINMKKKPVITACRFRSVANQVGAYCNFVRVHGEKLLQAH